MLPYLHSVFTTLLYPQMSSTSLLLYKKLDKNGNYFECVLNYKFTDHCSSKKIVQATIKTSPPLIVRVQTQYFKIATKKNFCSWVLSIAKFLYNLSPGTWFLIWNDNNFCTYLFRFSIHFWILKHCELEGK